MTGRRWHPDEDAKLRQMVADGADLGALTSAFTRSESGIISRLRDLKLRIARNVGGNASPWTAEEDKYLLDASARRVPLAAQAVHLRRSWHGLKRRLQKLRHEIRASDSRDAPQGVTRKCLACPVLFTRRPGERWTFMCEAHRNASASPFEPGCAGDSGRQRQAVRQ